MLRGASSSLSQGFAFFSDFWHWAGATLGPRCPLAPAEPLPQAQVLEHRNLPAGQVNAELPCLFAPFPGATPRLLRTQRDSSLSGCLQPANPERCLTARNNYLASFALSTFHIQGADKAPFPVAQPRNPSRLEAPTPQERLRDGRHRGISSSAPVSVFSGPSSPIPSSPGWVWDGPVPRFPPNPGTRNPTRPGDTTPG